MLLFIRIYRYMGKRGTYLSSLRMLADLDKGKGLTLPIVEWDASLP